MTREHYGALFFLAVSVAYLVLTFDIELWPGAEAAPFTPRTMPFGLGAVGIVIALLMLLKAPREAAEGDEKRCALEVLKGLQWRRVVLLALLMVVYGLTIKSIGFILSTAIFLFCGFAVMGERRWPRMAVISLAVTLGFWSLLSRMLDIYLDPGIFRFLG